MEEPQHIPVLAAETVELLRPRAGQVFVDGTVGGGGHASLFMDKLLPGGRLIALDKDGVALSRAKARLAPYGEAVTYVREDFRRLGDVLRAVGADAVDGVLLDVGVSSFQLDEGERGFSFHQDAPLDMRMDVRGGPTAAEVINTLPRRELTRLLRTYGEEPFASRIASVIVAERERTPLKTTGQLAELVKRAVPARVRRKGGHPARRTFQALRIAVNDELTALEHGVRAAVKALRPGGRVAVISFHSLEDRIVKQCFAEMANPCECPPELPVCRCGKQPAVHVVTRKPVVPRREEVEDNPRARSAKLRVAEKMVLIGKEGE